MSVNPSTVKGPVPALIEQSVRTVIGAIQQIATGGTPTLTPAQRRAFQAAGGRIVAGGSRGGGLQYFDPQGNRINYQSARTAAREGFPTGSVPMGQPTPPRVGPVPPLVRTPPPKVPKVPTTTGPGLPGIVGGTVAGQVIGSVIGPQVAATLGNWNAVLSSAINVATGARTPAGETRRRPTRRRGTRRTRSRETEALLNAQAGVQTAPAPTRAAERAPRRAPPRLRSARVKIPKYRPDLSTIQMPTPTIPRPAPTVSSVLAATPTWAREALIGGALALLASSSSRRARARAREPLLPLLPPGLADPLTPSQPGAVPFPLASPFGAVGGSFTNAAGQVCECKDPTKRKKRKKRRDVCYRGTYTETATGLRKRKARKVPC